MVGIYPEIKSPVFVNRHVSLLATHMNFTSLIGVVMHPVFFPLQRFNQNQALIVLPLWQVKWPGGKTHEDIFVETLLKHGYKGKYLSKEWKEQPLFIQSFAPTSLIQASKLTDSPLVLLIDGVDKFTQDTNQVSDAFHALLS